MPSSRGFRPIQDGDRAAVAGFLARVMPEHAAEDYLRRMRLWWDENPFCRPEHSRGWLVERDGEIGGLVCLYPMPFRVRGEDRLFGSMSSFALLPSLRGRGVSFSLIKHMLEHSDYGGFLATTPNPSASRIYDKLGYLRITDFPRGLEEFCLLGHAGAFLQMLLAIRGLGFAARAARPLLRRLGGLAPRAGRDRGYACAWDRPLDAAEGSLLASWPDPTEAHLARSAALLNWHHANGLGGRRLLQKLYRGGGLVAASLYARKAEHHSGIPYLQLMDAWAEPGEEAARHFRRLAEHARDHCRAHGLAMALMWAKSEDEARAYRALSRRVSRARYDYQVLIRPAAPDALPPSVGCTLLDGDRGFQL